jgi:hypothetical protein
MLGQPRMQKLLLEHGFYCGEDDDEVFFFGEGTLSAVLTFQACNGLRECGYADAETWHALTAATPCGSTSHVVEDAAVKGLTKEGEPFGGLFAGLTVQKDTCVPPRAPAAVVALAQNGSDGSDVDDLPARSAADKRAALLRSDAPPKYTEWPVLREGDGTRAVHSMQVGVPFSGSSLVSFV